VRQPAPVPPPMTYQRPPSTAEPRPWRGVCRSAARAPAVGRRIVEPKGGVARACRRAGSRCRGPGHRPRSRRCRPKSPDRCSRQSGRRPPSPAMVKCCSLRGRSANRCQRSAAGSSPSKILEAPKLRTPADQKKNSGKGSDTREAAGPGSLHAIDLRRAGARGGGAAGQCHWHPRAVSGASGHLLLCRRTWYALYMSPQAAKALCRPAWGSSSPIAATGRSWRVTARPGQAKRQFRPAAQLRPVLHRAKRRGRNRRARRPTAS
jgi:hypothetical protein